LNKIRRVAEDLVARYPTLFTSNFDKNKQALSQVSVISARSIRNQLAGAITRLVNEKGQLARDHGELTLGERIMTQVDQESAKAEAESARENQNGTDEAKQETAPTQ
jgi:small subunit ribosomal protein S17e